MTRKTRIMAIGKSQRDRFFGETWTVVSITPGADILLQVGDRLRTEGTTNPAKANMYPDSSTKLFAKGFTKIPLKRIKQNSTVGRWYQFESLLNGVMTPLWLTEGGVGTSEAEITKDDPRIKGGNGGLAGVRR